MLKNKELSHAQQIVRKAANGCYTLKQLYGDKWHWITRPQVYGQEFRDAVGRGDLPGVRWAGRGSDRSNRYEVAHPSADWCADLDELWSPTIGQAEAKARGVLPTHAHLSSKSLQEAANSASVAIKGATAI